MLRHPWRTLLMVGLCVAVCGGLITRLRISTSLKPMFAGDDPASVAMGRLLDDFVEVDRLNLLVRFAGNAPTDRQGRVGQLLAFRDRVRTAIDADDEGRAMVVAIGGHPDQQARRFVQEVIAPAGMYYLDDAGIKRLRQRLTGEGIVEQIRRNEAVMAAPAFAGGASVEVVRHDPLRLHELLVDALSDLPGGFNAGIDNNDTGVLIDAEAQAMLVSIVGSRPASDMAFTKRFMPVMRRVIERMSVPNLRVDFAGAYAIAELSEQQIRGDMTRSVMMSVVLLQLIFLVAYRNVWSFALAFAPVVAGIVVGFGLFSFFASELMPMTAVLGGVLAGLGVDYAIHYLSHYENRRMRGDSVPRSAKLRGGLGVSMGAACGTSLIAFLALTASSVQVLRSFALLGVLGLGSVFVGSLVVLPALLVLTDRRAKLNTQSMRPRLRVDGLVREIAGRPARAFVATGALLAGAVMVLLLAGGGAIHYQSDMSIMHPQPNPPLETQQWIARRFTNASDTMQVYLQADSPTQLLRLAHDVAHRLRDPALAARGVGKLFGLHSLLPDPNVAARRRWQVHQIDTDQVVVDFRAALENSIFNPSAYADYKRFLRALLRPGDPPGINTLAGYPEVARMLLPRTAFETKGSSAMQAILILFVKEAFADSNGKGPLVELVRKRLAGIPGATLTGMNVIAHDMRRSIQRDLLRLLAIALACVTVFLAVVFGYASGNKTVPEIAGAVLLSLSPAAFGIVCLLAVMHLTDTDLNMVNLIALPLIVGIGVDDGIFLVILMGGRPTADDRQRPLPALSASCHAITVTSATTTLAFVSLLTTSVPAVRSLGLVLAVGIAACWVGSVFGVAPLLLLLLRGRGCQEAKKCG